MSLAERFEAAQALVKTLPQTPDAGTLLELYALYKQATAGNVESKRPSFVDLKGRAKFDAWEAKKGLAKDGAMTAYAALVDRLIAGK